MVTGQFAGKMLMEHSNRATEESLAKRSHSKAWACLGEIHIGRWHTPELAIVGTLITVGLGGIGGMIFGTQRELELQLQERCILTKLQPLVEESHPLPHSPALGVCQWHRQ